MINVEDVDGAADDLIMFHHGGAAVVLVLLGVAMATDSPSTLLLQEEPTPSPFFAVSSVRVAAVLLLLCRPEAFAQSQPLEPLFPSLTDTISLEPSFPTTTTSCRYLGHSCHPCPPPRGHPHQA
jgi:hypothetical protein